ncbi:MAG: hypothetical protein ACRDH8_10205 [Actinomycetota bacterium]
MNDQYPGWYYLYAFGGLAAIVAVVVVVALRQPATSADAGPVLRVLVIALTLWFLGYFAFWFYWLVFRDPTPAPTSPGGNVFRSWSALAASMASGPHAEAALARAERAYRLPMALFLLYGMVLVGCVLTGAWLWGIGVKEVAGIPLFTIWPATIVTLAVAYVVFMFVGPGFSRMVQSSQEYLEPLGLEIVGLPDISLGSRPGGGTAVRVSGASRMAGTRHGRRVEIQVTAAKSVTAVELAGQPFEVRSAGGSFRPSPGLHRP